jgi:hypothetical protein
LCTKTISQAVEKLSIHHINKILEGSKCRIVIARKQKQKELNNKPFSRLDDLAI